MIPDPPLLVITVMKGEIQNIIQLINVTIAIVFLDIGKNLTNILNSVSEVQALYILFKIKILNVTKTMTGYISEIEGGSMFATLYCLMFNFHPKLKMTPITCLRSFGQNEEELKNITIPEKFWPYTNKDKEL